MEQQRLSPLLLLVLIHTLSFPPLSFSSLLFPTLITLWLNAQIMILNATVRSTILEFPAVFVNHPASIQLFGILALLQPLSRPE